MPTIPSKEEIKLMEAQHYANELKLEELKKQGVDVTKLQELRKVELGKKMFEPDEERKLPPEPKIFDKEYYAGSFEEFRVKLLFQ